MAYEEGGISSPVLKLSRVKYTTPLRSLELLNRKVPVNSSISAKYFNRSSHFSPSTGRWVERDEVTPASFMQRKTTRTGFDSEGFQRHRSVSNLQKASDVGIDFRSHAIALIERSLSTLKSPLVKPYASRVLKRNESQMSGTSLWQSQLKATDYLGPLHLRRNESGSISELGILERPKAESGLRPKKPRLMMPIMQGRLQQLMTVRKPSLTQGVLLSGRATKVHSRLAS